MGGIAIWPTSLLPSPRWRGAGGEVPRELVRRDCYLTVITVRLLQRRNGDILREINRIGQNTQYHCSDGANPDGD